jgi:large subunit ribosomal protein L6
MSRIGKKAIEIPSSVTVMIENQKIITKGKNGTLEKSFLDFVELQKSEDKIIITRKNDSKESKSYHGLTRALVQNMVTGVTTKFSKTLIAEGVGYKFQLDKKQLIVNVGY